MLGHEHGVTVDVIDCSRNFAVKELALFDTKRRQTYITCLAVSSDGVIVACASIDSLSTHLPFVTVWNQNEGFKPVRFHCDVGSVASLAFSSDSLLLAAGGGSDIAIVYDLRIEPE